MYDHVTIKVTTICTEIYSAIELGILWKLRNNVFRSSLIIPFKFCSKMSLNFFLEIAVEIVWATRSKFFRQFFQFLFSISSAYPSDIPHAILFKISQTTSLEFQEFQSELLKEFAMELQEKLLKNSQKIFQNISKNKNSLRNFKRNWLKFLEKLRKNPNKFLKVLLVKFLMNLPKV